jgi:hypothetical protein
MKQFVYWTSLNIGELKANSFNEAVLYKCSDPGMNLLKAIDDVD